MIGNTYGTLTIIAKGPSTAKNSTWWCKCICGREKLVVRTQLKYINSCGCLSSEIMSKAHIKHGHSKHKRDNGKCSNTYNVWCSMKKRCTSPNRKDNSRYKDRGIFVCDRWLKFENFLEDMGEVPKGLQLNRINNDDGYYKDNCNWVTPQENSRNKSNNIKITFNGSTKTLEEWGIITGINPTTIKNRLDKNLSIEMIFKPGKVKYTGKNRKRKNEK